MKTNPSFLALSAFALLLSSCEEQERMYEDSSQITVNLPTRKQAIEDQDSVIIKAVIEPVNSSVVSYQIWLIDNNKNWIYNKQQSCDCKGVSAVNIEGAFLYDIDKTSDLILNVHAKLENGTHIREEIPFRLVDSQKK
jgi:hypothetical protein